MRRRYRAQHRRPQQHHFRAVHLPWHSSGHARSRGTRHRVRHERCDARQVLRVSGDPIANGVGTVQDVRTPA